MKLVNVPGINGLNKTKGCEKFPERVLDDFNNIDKIKIDLTLDDIEKDSERIFNKSKELFGYGEKLLFLGGDHSISYPVCKSFLEDCEKRGVSPCLIIFDAHPDCMKPMKEPTHEEWLRALIEDGFPPGDILLVGVRNSWKDETEYLKEKGVQILKMEALTIDTEDACDTLMEFSKGRELYVSIDIDVVDPVFAPGTGYLEVGGLSGQQMLYIASRINKMKNLRAVDLVEINPDKDKDGITVKLGREIIKKFLS